MLQSVFVLLDHLTAEHGAMSTAARPFDSPPPNPTEATVAPDKPVHDSKPTADYPGLRPMPLASALQLNLPGYEILGLLGRGGMGVVYKARQTKVNRLVALKMVLTGNLASDEERLRFLIEGEVLGRLQHPHIVQIYEVGTLEGQPYFALEYVEGGNLAEQLKKHKLPALEAASLVEKIARAVHYAHSNGIIHRDLKPANILLARKSSERKTEIRNSKFE